jgi:hypothetical protein
MQGDTCPGLVLDADEGLIAVWADMTSDPNKRTVPAIKITKVPLRRAAGSPLKVGQRLTAVSTYSGPDGVPSWKDFTPIPVVCATRDPETIQASLASIPDDQWLALDAGLKEIPRNTGIHLIASQRRART